jgi:hypothetical protein
VALYDDLSDRAVLEQHLAINLFGTYGVTVSDARSMLSEWWRPEDLDPTVAVGRCLDPGEVDRTGRWPIAADGFAGVPIKCLAAARGVQAEQSHHGGHHEKCVGHATGGDRQSTCDDAMILSVNVNQNLAFEHVQGFVRGRVGV